ncbi:MAG: molybdopterin synthase sulfur carrier subunit [Gammaproteobacteria bacterium TMED1]|nr:MAG: molybdopterin synthase sulfur carrier subunit [Gammaproteobacteria bacterium TMED1]
MIRVLLFSRLREELNSSVIEIPACGISNVSCLVEKLEDSQGKAWGCLLKGENILVSVNQILVHDDHYINDGDEVAFFPPVTGG